MFLHILDLDLRNLGPNVRNPGISNNDVKMIDAVGCKLLHSIGRVSGTVASTLMTRREVPSALGNSARVLDVAWLGSRLAAMTV